MFKVPAYKGLIYVDKLEKASLIPEKNTDVSGQLTLNRYKLTDHTRF